MTPVDTTPATGRQDPDRDVPPTREAGIPPHVITVVEAAACHLCDDAKSALATSYPLTVRVLSISEAYGTLGKGMHSDLPGHSFILIDKTGKQRWYGEYPSMFISPDDLLTEVNNHLTS